MKLDQTREELLRRVNALRDLVANFPNDPRMAEINWEIASTMARLGNDHCEFYFKQAMQGAKGSEWPIKAKISRADYLMSIRKVDDAIQGYNDARQTAPDDLKAYATYRLGWAFLAKAWAQPEAARGEALKKAEAAWKLVVVTRKEDAETRFRLRAEAARDLAWLWAIQGNDKEPATFFAKEDLEDTLPVFQEKQALAWLDHKQVARAAAYYQGLLTKAPADPKAPDYHLRLAHAFLAAGDVDGLQRERAAIAALTTVKENPWLEEHEGDQAMVSRAETMAALLPLTAGIRLYQTADAEKDPKKKKALLVGAVKELQDYAKRSPNDPQIATIRATMVTGLIALDKLPEALDQLDELIKLGHRADGVIANAAFERLNILVKLDGEQKYPALPEAGTVKTPLTLPPLKTRFAAAASDYLKIVPKADIEPNLRFQMAQDLFSYGHYGEALPRFEKLVLEFPRSDQARGAVEALLSYHMKHDDWDELVRLGEEFLNDRSLKGKALRDYIRQNYEYAKTRKKG